MSENGADVQSDDQLGSSGNLYEVAESDSAGAMLAAARIKKEWTLGYVAEQLKLSEKQIISLETDQFDRLPRLVIVRGFIRSYAKLLKIDADSVIAMLPSGGDSESAVASLRPTLTTPFQESRLPMLGRQDNNNKQYIGGSVILGLLALSFFAFQKFEHSSYLERLFSTDVAGTVVKQPNVNSDGTIGESNHVSEPIIVASAAVSASELPSAGSNVSALTQDAAKLSSDLPSGASNLQLASIAKSGIDTVATANNNLVLKFKTDSWIQIRRENGNVITSHLAKAGTEEVFEVKELLQVRIGNVAGVDAFLRGDPYPISGTQGSNVTNFNVK